VLGASGMLGSMVVDFLSRHSQLRIAACVRQASWRSIFERLLPAVQWEMFRWDGHSQTGDFRCFEGQDWVINCIGITKPLIRDDSAERIEEAVAVNAVLPHHIGRHAQACGSRVLQIATDCVYSGRRGMYVETDPHDALDVYGKSKSLGESFQPNVHHLRCSIIGPEPKDFKFLVEWFRRQPRDAQVNGFVNHQWNGLTTLHFAKLCWGIIYENVALPHVQHVIPNGTVSKAGMLHEFARAYKRTDITIRDVEAEFVTDRTLATQNHGLNAALWKAAGYRQAPNVPDMIQELAGYEYRARVEA